MLERESDEIGQTVTRRTLSCSPNFTYTTARLQRANMLFIEHFTRLRKTIHKNMPSPFPRTTFYHVAQTCRPVPLQIRQGKSVLSPSVGQGTARRSTGFYPALQCSPRWNHQWDSWGLRVWIPRATYFISPFCHTPFLDSG